MNESGNSHALDTGLQHNDDLQEKALIERAFEELQNTISLAQQYWRSTEKYPEELKSHAEAIEEDTNIFEKCRLPKERQKAALDLAAEGRRLKREMIRAAYMLQRQNTSLQPGVAQQAVPTATTVIEKKSSTLKLPPIKLPMFEGRIENYRGFMDALTDALNNETGITDVKKWIVLRSQLEGKALELVQDLPTAPESYKVAVELLEDTYGSKRKATVNLYQKIQALPYAINDDDSLRTTNARLEGVLKSLEHLGVDVEGNDFLRSVVLGKYPSEIINQLLITDTTPLQDIRNKMGQYIRARECGIRQTSCTQHPQKQQQQAPDVRNRQRPENRSNKSTYSASGTEDCKENKVISNDTKKIKKLPPKSIRCAFCDERHWADECQKYATVAQRTATLKERCIRCLRKKHDGSACNKMHKCVYCQENSHNRALCPKQFDTSKTMFAVNSEQSRIKKEKLVTIVVPVSNGGRKIEARAILDTGSEKSLISQSLVDELQLSKDTGKRMNFTGVGGTSLHKSPSQSRMLKLHPPEASSIEVEVYVVPEICGEINTNDIQEFKKVHPKYRDLSMPPEGNGKPVQLLLGCNVLPSILTLQKSIYVNAGTQLMSTKFGWTIFGDTEENDEETTENAAIYFISTADPVKIMADLELIGLKELEIKDIDDEEKALKTFYSTIKYEQNRYQVTWPWRSHPPDIANNFGLAWGRLQSLYKKLSTNEVLLEAYDNIIREQCAMDIVEKVPEKENTSNIVHYIAHQAVIKLEKSTPVRIVYDGSAKGGQNKKSLNDNILKGANWVEKLPSLLLRFRRYLVGVTADIEKAFHQIAIAPEDRDAVRFLWLKDIKKPPTSDNIVVYRFKRVAFGIIASPYLLYATIKYHLKENPHAYSNIVESDMYADNLVTSLPKGTDWKLFYDDVKKGFTTMSMSLTKWVTNGSALNDVVAQQDLGSNTEISVLGVLWDHQTDTFRLKMPMWLVENVDKITKRKVLKETASIYDPLGFVTPIVLLAKIFIRKLWLQKLNWDGQINDEMAKEWRKIRENLKEAGKFSIPRTYGAKGFDAEDTKHELHVFADASMEAYGIVVYLRSIHKNGDAEISFVAAKSRLTPKTKLSIPRLELLAAVTACRYVRYINTALKIENVNIHFWGDSQCVLAWIHSARQLPSIVEKMVSQIHAQNISSFAYVPTEINPADHVTRGATFTQLQQASWWNGPHWLKTKNNWPQEPEMVEQNQLAMNIQKEHQLIMLMQYNNVQEANKIDIKNIKNSPFGLNPNDFSEYTRLMKRTSFCAEALRKFDKNKRTKNFSGSEPLHKNYDVSRRIWFLWDQGRAYKETESKSNVAYLKNIKVIKGEDGLLRCKTRLFNASIQQASYEPILLVKNSSFTKLLIMHIHQTNMHVGTSHTLAALRRSYWLPHGRRTVYKTIKENCHQCRRYDAQPYKPPEMPQLPPFRVQRTETPFTHIGMDAFGPFKVRMGPHRDSQIKKCWIVVYTCLVIRAIHLEFLQDMNAETFLHAFRRFTGRRGIPQTVVCDNAPQFYVIKGRFQTLWQAVQEDQQATSYFATHSITWKFIPPHSPWMGGAYERLIKIIKDSICRTFNNTIINEEQFKTVIIELEAIVNSRPITYVDKEIETTLISPNNFLSVKYPAAPLSFEEQETTDRIITLWKATENHLDVFWKQWADQYLLYIRERREITAAKIKDNIIKPKQGDVVLMVDPGSKRATWRLAIIERLIPSADGQIRSAQVKICNGARMIRPLTKLASVNLLADVSSEQQLNADQTALIVPGSESAHGDNRPE